MTKILAIDASSDSCSAALIIGDTVIERSELAPRKHTELILPMVDAVLSEAGLGLSQMDAIAFNRGPGSFTGVRVSTSVAQGLAFALDLPVVPVSGLAAVAQQAFRLHQYQQCLAVVDARMSEVYWGYYRLEQGVMRCHGDEHVSAVTSVTLPQTDQWYAVGSGVKVYAQQMLDWPADRLIQVPEEFNPQAHDVALLGQAEFIAGNVLSASEAQPVYLRDKVV